MLINWIKKITEKLREIPLPKFIKDFMAALDNSKSGHGLKKWLTVGFFWIIFEATLRFTTKDNLVEVLIILSSTLLALAGIYSVANYQDKKLTIKDNKPTEDANTGKPEEP